MSQNIKICPRADSCSVNACPLVQEANQRNLVGEECCPFCLKKKARSQKGIRTLAPAGLLQFIPECNVKMLNRRNQKGWSAIQIAKSNCRMQL